MSNELKFSKKKQLYKAEEMCDRDRDKRFRLCMAYLTYFFATKDDEELNNIEDHFKGLDLHHINGKGSHQLRYGMGNVAFISRQEHQEIHRTKKSDPRMERVARHIDTIDFTK